MDRRDPEIPTIGRALLTATYSSLFGTANTTTELWLRSWQLPGEKHQTKQQLVYSLGQLQQLGWLNKTNDLWYLASQPKHVSNRKRRQQISEKKLAQAQPLISFLQNIPWIEGTAVTGSVAMNSAEVNDDIDFMIVTKPNRLWLTRLIVLLYAIKMGKRRSFAREEPNSWCLNLWLSSNAMAVPFNRRSLYTAYEVCQAKWVFGHNQTPLRFLQANAWAHSILPRYFQWKQHHLKTTIQKFDKKSWLVSALVLFNSPLLTFFNALAELFQRLYMKHHQTQEFVDHQRAYFHPDGRTDSIYRAIKQSLSSTSHSLHLYTK